MAVETVTMQFHSFRYPIPAPLIYLLGGALGFLLATRGRLTQGVSDNPGSFLLFFAGACLALWLLSLGLRVHLLLFQDSRILQLSYRFFGGQLGSREIPLDQVLATGVRYWATKEVHYQPVLALACGKLLGVGHVHKTWSLTGAGDSGIFQSARHESEAIARSLGVQCLIKDPDSALCVINGQAVVTNNSRQSTMQMNTLAMGAAAIMFIVVALFLHR